MLLSGNSILLFFIKLLKTWKTKQNLFATRINKQLDRYLSWYPEPEAMAINAFSLTCNNNYFYMFSPFSLVGRVLAKIHRDKTNAVIFVPDRSTQYWYPQLLQMTNQDPLYFQPSLRNLTLPHEPPTMQKTPVNSNQGNNTTENVLEASLRLSTHRKYDNHIKQWTSY